jgi:hypothetical protein
MRVAVGILALALALAGCAAVRGTDQPTPTTAPAPTTARTVTPTVPDAAGLSVPGYEGEIEPIASPVELTYGDAQFRSAVTIGVEDGDGTTAGTNSLAVHLAGELAPDGDRVRGEVITESVEIDGRPLQQSTPFLVQDLLLDRKGRLIELASRWPAHSEASEPPSGGYRALEERWRDRLPVFASAAVSTGDPVYEQTGLLTPLRQMLQDRPFRMRTVRPVRAIAVGLTSCDGDSCLIARHEGEAELVAERGTLRVTAGGFTLIDLATGVIRREVGTVTLDGPGDSSRLVMTMRTDTQLF